MLMSTSPYGKCKLTFTKTKLLATFHGAYCWRKYAFVMYLQLFLVFLIFLIFVYFSLCILVAAFNLQSVYVNVHHNVCHIFSSFCLIVVLMARDDLPEGLKNFSVCLIRFAVNIA